MSRFEADWRARFERFAARGGTDATISGWSEHGMQRRLELVLAALSDSKLADRARVLDLGCGSGVYCLHFRELGLRPVGADYSPGMLKRAEAVLSAVDGLPAVPLAAADLLRLPFDDDAFGGLVNVGVLQHVSDARGALHEMNRVLEPGGAGVVVTLNARSLHAVGGFALALVRAWRRGRFWPERHAVRRPVGALAADARAAGLDVREIRGVYLFPRGLRFLERPLDALDRLRVFGRPLLLPLANAYLLRLRSGAA